MGDESNIKYLERVARHRERLQRTLSSEERYREQEARRTTELRAENRALADFYNEQRETAEN